MGVGHLLFMDEDRKWFDVVWVFVEWLPVLVAGGVGPRVLAWS